MFTAFTKVNNLKVGRQWNVLVFVLPTFMLAVIMSTEATVENCQGTVCHEKAICHDEVEGGVQCHCMDGYIGDGFTFCTGTQLSAFACNVFTEYSYF